MRIGRAEAKRVTAIQKARPPTGEYSPRNSKPLAIGMSGSRGNRRVVTTSATTLVVTTPAM
jgi:hypothetical protein